MTRKGNWQLFASLMRYAADRGAPGLCLLGEPLSPPGHGGCMSSAELSQPDRYRETAREIREAAYRTQNFGVREELLGLAERYEKMAERAEMLAR